MILGFVYMVLMRYATGPMVWACILIYLLAIGGLAYVFYNRALEYKYYNFNFLIFLEQN